MNRLNRRTLLLGGLGFALILAAWPWLQARNGLDATNVQGDAFRIRSIEVFIRQADRIPTILFEIARYYAWRPWIVIPFLAAVVSSSVSGDRLDRGRRFLMGFVAVHLVFVTTVFWATQMPFEWHLGSASHRLLLQGQLVMLLFVFETATREWAPFFVRSTPRHRVAFGQTVMGTMDRGRVLANKIAEIVRHRRYPTTPTKEPGTPAWT